MIYNRIIKRLIVEMVMITSMVIGTWFIWQNIDCSEQAKMAYAYSNYDAYLTLNVDKDSINILSNGEQSDGLTLSIGNSNSIVKSYYLYCIYDNDSKLDKDFIEVEINNSKIKLNSLEKIEKGNYTYFILDKNSIKKKSTKNLDVKILLADNTPLEEYGKDASIKFDIEEI